MVYFHGSPGSRLEGALLGPAAERLGLRVIAVDRPGFGRSDPKPSRMLLEWPQDVQELADGLTLDRFAVLGASGGGPYAAACARAIPHRLTAAGIICGVAPFHGRAAEHPMLRRARPMFAVLRRAPWLATLAMWPLMHAIRRHPDAALRRMARFMPEPDRVALTRPDVRQVFLQSLPEALCQGVRSARTELMLYARPWGFALEEIGIPVYLWQGELDRSVPPEMARYQASAIPICKATFYDDEGHLSIGVNRIEEMLRTLVRGIETPSGA